MQNPTDLKTEDLQILLGAKIKAITSNYDGVSLDIVFEDGRTLHIGCNGGMGYNAGMAWLDFEIEPEKCKPKELTTEERFAPVMEKIREEELKKTPPYGDWRDVYG